MGSALPLEVNGTAVTMGFFVLPEVGLAYLGLDEIIRRRMVQGTVGAVEVSQATGHDGR